MKKQEEINAVSYFLLGLCLILLGWIFWLSGNICFSWLVLILSPIGGLLVGYNFYKLK